ncbi:ABC transporter substrate-binding protein [Maridesulfovibrio frigidus]|uniref:ABC transporter substrate-binding protein n=1 Tax=Maridesulfovibrio frigidus TaxID=340956 RepID=UPI0004E14E53|nr:ABC transporter substrate-binding protein [Maridesulfovibrio frigidus]
MNFKKAAIIFGLIIMMVSALGGCSGEKSASGPELRVGVIGVTSGELFRKGTYILAAARYAAEEVNAEGGVDISGVKHSVKLFPVDSGGTSEIATSMALRLIDQDKVSVIIGGASSAVALAIAKVCEEKKVPFITPVASTNKLTSYKYAFRVSYTNSVQAAALSRFVSDKLKSESVAVLYDADNTYSAELATLFKKDYSKRGGKVVAFESYPAGSREYDAQLKNIVAANPKILFLPNNTKKIQIQARQAIKLGFKGILLGGDSWDPVDLLRNDIFKNSYFTDHWFPGLPIPGSAKFEVDYKKKNGVDPTEMEALTYDAAMSVFAAIKKDHSDDPIAIHDGLVDMPPFAGVTGKFDYNNNGDPAKDVFISHLKDGHVVLADTIFVE